MGKKIVAFGEVVWDILPAGKVLGGTPLNLLFRSNALGEKCYLLSRLGDDKLGREALEKLNDLEISDRYVQIDSEFKTGTVDVTFDTKNEPIFKFPIDVAFDHIEFSADALKLVRKADCLVYGLLPQRFGISKNTLRELIKESPDSMRFFDLKLFQHFFNNKIVEDLLKAAHIVRIKEREVVFLAKELGVNLDSVEGFSETFVKKYGINMLIITRGEKGVMAYHKHKGLFFQPGFKVNLKDNVGSGMAFAAGFLHYHLNGKSIRKALAFGCASGALNCTKHGATEHFSKKDILNFMKDTPTTS